EAARVLSKSKFQNSIMLVGLSGEEQGLVGGKYLAEKAKTEGWDIIGVINNDMIGNSEGITNIKDNRSFRIFSEPVPSELTEQQKIWYRFYGGEVDGPSRQLARYIESISRKYLPDLNPMLVYRIDRFGRGGHHQPFNDVGFTAVRLMETHEHYDHQHQDVRTEDGRVFGDLIEYVDFDYAAKLTAVNIVTLASLADSPPPPLTLMIGGIVSPSTQLKWTMQPSNNLAGYKVYWRESSAPIWEHNRWVGMNDNVTLENIIIDHYLFGVSSVSKDGHESIVQYPMTLMPRPVQQ
ncbi:MAG: M28 family peptidase, partial [Saprospiraceae bacterium]